MRLRTPEPDGRLIHAANAAATAARRLAAALVSADANGAALAEVTALLAAAQGKLAPYLRPARHYSPLEGREPGDRIFGPVRGSANPVAPPVAIQHHADRVEGRCILGRVYEGPRGFAHGGVSSFLLDEVSAQVPELVGLERVTTTLTLRFRRPVPLDVPLLLTGRRRPGELDIVDSTIAIEDDPGRALVSAEAHFVRLRPDQVERFRRLSGDGSVVT